MLVGLLCLAFLAPAAHGAVTLPPVGTFDRPVFLTSPPGDIERVFVVERGGTVRLMVGGVTQQTPYLDLRSLVNATGDEQGLLSLAFAPDFATSRRLYVYYTGTAAAAGGSGDIVIDEYQAASPAAPTVDVATRRRVLTIPHQGADNHNGGQLAFGPDGLLWLATGDGGGAGDTDGNAQRTTSRLGKMLRIDPRPGVALSPTDNPFAASGGAAEVWSSGLRNPWRFSFDRVTGDLAIADVGQGFVEEVNLVSRVGGLGRGANYGWNALEGRYRYGSSPMRLATPNEYPAGNVLPVIEQLHSAGWCSITGGYVVRDPNLSDLVGKYVYGDFCRGEIWSASLSTSGAVANTATGLTATSISSFGEDGCGRVYVLSLNGPVRRLSDSGRCAGPAPTPFPVPPGNSAGDTTSPTVVATTSPRQKFRGRPDVRVRVSCDEPCLVRGTGRLTIGTGSRAKVVFLVPVARRIGPGQPVVLRLQIPKRARAAVASALAARRRVVVSLTVLARDGAQNRTVRRRIVQIIRG